MPAARLNLCPEIAAMMMNPSVPSSSKASLLCLAAFTAGLWAGEPPAPDAFASAFAPSQAVYERLRSNAAARKAAQRERDSHCDSHAENVTVTPADMESPVIPTDCATVDKCDSHCDSHTPLLIKEEINLNSSSIPEEGAQGEPGSVTVTGTVTQPEKRQTRFVRPPLEAVAAYCEERRNGINAQSFLDFYDSKGWMIGKNHMKDWKAAVRTWERMRFQPQAGATRPRAEMARRDGGREGQFDGIF